MILHTQHWNFISPSKIGGGSFEILGIYTLFDNDTRVHKCRFISEVYLSYPPAAEGFNLVVMEFPARGHRSRIFLKSWLQCHRRPMKITGKSVVSFAGVKEISPYPVIMQNQIKDQKCTIVLKKVFSQNSKTLFQFCQVAAAAPAGRMCLIT